MTTSEEWHRIFAPLAQEELDKHPAPVATAASHPVTALSMAEWVENGGLAAWKARKAQEARAAATGPDSAPPRRAE